MQLLWYLLIFTNIINFNKLKRTMENYQNQNEPQNYQNANFNNGNGNFMTTNLPNGTAVLILGIISILGCCCYGIVGLICGIIGLVLAKKDVALYKQNPSAYNNFSNLNTGRILCIIGVVLSVIYLIANIVLLAMYGFDGIQEMQQQWIEQMQNQQ